VRVYLLALAAGFAAVSALAQSPPPPASPSPSPSPTTTASPAQPSSDYRVGAGDVLEVTVFGNEDLSRAPAVQTSGTIALPLLGEVQVSGLTVSEIKNKLTNLLARDYLVNPQVDVKVKEFQSQFVTVMGEVNSPGRKALRGRTRLIDALVEAGGFTPRASGEVVITRLEGGFEGGEKSLRMRLGSASLSLQDQINLEVVLKTGDVITASPKYYVTVEGEVARPGRYSLDGDLALTGAISMAGGLTRFGSSDVKLRRLDTETGKASILELDLKEIRKGKQQDPRIMPNDVVSVPRRVF
jgi:polysaccharide export outer membrane protein